MPATMSPARTPQAHPAREIALRPYLDKLRNWLEQVETMHPDQPAQITIESSKVTLEGWDRQQLQRFFDKETKPACIHAELMAHAIAMLCKVSFDISQLQNDDGSDSAKFYALQGELMLDSALGIAVLHETQTTINKLIQDGLMADAKAMSLLRHQIIHAVNVARRCIANSDFDQAESLATALGAPADCNSVLDESIATTSIEQRQSVPIEAVETVNKKTRKRQRRQSSQAKQAADAGFPVTMGLAILLAATAVFFAITVGVPTVLDRSPEMILRSDLANPKEFVDLVALPSSIYVTIDSERWNQLDERERRQTIDNLGIRAASAGYAGLLLRTLDGQPVARWLNKRGFELIEYHETAPLNAIGY